MVKNTRTFFDEEIDKKRQDFEAHLDNVKVLHYLHEILVILERI